MLAFTDAALARIVASTRFENIANRIDPPRAPWPLMPRAVSKRTN
jgi:hypothetical protein